MKALKILREQGVFEDKGISCRKRQKVAAICLKKNINICGVKRRIKGPEIKYLRQGRWDAFDKSLEQC